LPERLEEGSADTGAWAAAGVIEPGPPDPSCLALALDGHGRLRPFLSFQTATDICCLEQASPSGVPVAEENPQLPGADAAGTDPQRGNGPRPCPGLGPHA
jgi:hypothetical protein